MAPLAQTAPTQIDVNAWLNSVSPGVIIVGLCVVALPAVLTTIKLSLDIIRWFRKDPPAHETFASKGDLTALEGRVNERIGNVARDLGHAEIRLNQRIEDATADIKALEERITEQLREGTTLFNSIQRELHTLTGQTSELRGLLEGLRQSFPSGGSRPR